MGQDGQQGAAGTGTLVITTGMTYKANIKYLKGHNMQHRDHTGQKMSK